MTPLSCDWPKIEEASLDQKFVTMILDVVLRETQQAQQGEKG